MNTKIYLAAMALAAAASSCSNDFELPPMIVPEASMKPTTTIADFKQTYWQSDRNYCSEVRALTDDTDLIIEGRVVSSDSTGNIFKNVIIDDGTAAITIAINAYDLYKSYQYGQKILVNCTGLKVGGYNGLMQMGAESSYNGQPSMTFMEKDLFDSHSETNGLSDPSAVVPQLVTIPELAAAKADQNQLMLMQSRLVKIDSVKFEDAGQMFAPDKTIDRYVVDKEGNRINVRCSSYSSFKNDYIPSGYGCVTAILSYYGSDWQLMLNGLSGLQDFGPAEPAPEPPSGIATFKKVAAITSGKMYVIIADGKMATPIAEKTYGYLQTVDVEPNADGEVAVDISNAFTFEASGDGFVMKALDKYYYLSGTYNSFNTDSSMPTEGAIWKAEPQESGAIKLVNVEKNKSLQYDAQYKSYGCYDTVKGTFPTFYELAQ